MNIHKHYKKILAIIILVLLLLFYFFNSKPADKTQYITQHAEKGTISNNVLATGSVNAFQKVSVGAQVSGQITKLSVKLGDKVKKGDLIAEIDSTTQKNDLETAISNLGIYESQLKSKIISLNIAKIQYQRQSYLSRQNAGSKEDLETYKNNLALAQSNVEELQANIKQANIAVSTAKTNLGYTKIVAPLEGVVVSTPVEEGQTVNSNQTTPTIVEIANLDKVKIKAEISEGDITKVKPGQSVTFSILSNPEKQYQTTLNSVDPGPTTLSETSSSSTSTSSSSSTSSSAIYYYGNLIVDNKDNLLRIDMTTQISIAIDKAENVLVIPKIALKSDDRGNYVNILVNNEPLKKYIKTGISDSLNIAVESGISQGDNIITSQLSNDEKIDSNQPRRPPMGM